VGDAESVVVSTAIPPTNLEVLEARRRSIPVIPRARALATILENARGIAIAGTHGKTTTTSMTAHVLRAMGENPTALVGGELNDIGSNVAFGSPDLIVAEADESDRSLLMLHPKAAVVTNVEFDHPDFYASLDDVLQTFERFVTELPKDGHLICCADDANCLKLADVAPCPVTTYGLAAGDLRAQFLSPNSYVLFEDEAERGKVELGVHGRHNISNSLAAAAVARWLGHDALLAARSLADFAGVRRRFQLKGEHDTIRVVDDYAHHPTELRATLEAARATTDGRVIAVFQPHRYSRTRKLYREFGDSFTAADAVLITDVYGAGESPQPGVNGKLIVDAICETDDHPDIYYVPDGNNISRVLRQVSHEGDTVLTLGAGDITQVGDEFLKLLKG
jgi:UDP-N-acetylmuramate--alanine ligase